MTCWLNLPGTASTLIPNEGTAQECKTSEAVTRNLILADAGTCKILSTSNKRKSLFQDIHQPQDNYQNQHVYEKQIL